MRKEAHRALPRFWTRNYRVASFVHVSTVPSNLCSKRPRFTSAPSLRSAAEESRQFCKYLPTTKLFLLLELKKRFCLPQIVKTKSIVTPTSLHKKQREKRKPLHKKRPPPTHITHNTSPATNMTTTTTTTGAVSTSHNRKEVAHYVVTAFPPGAVLNAVTCDNFTSESSKVS